jgi:hypothetical protein
MEKAMKDGRGYIRMEGLLKVERTVENEGL